MPRRKRKRIVRQKGKRQGGPNREHQSASEVFSHKDCDITFVDVKKVRHQGEQALRSYTEDNYMCMSGDMSRNKAYTTALYVHLNTFASENDKKIVTILDVGTGAHALWLKTCARIWETELRQDPSRLLLLGIEIIPKSAVSALGVLRHATKSEARIVNKFSFDTTPSDFELLVELHSLTCWSTKCWETQCQRKEPLELWKTFTKNLVWGYQCLSVRRL